MRMEPISHGLEPTRVPDVYCTRAYTCVCESVETEDAHAYTLGERCNEDGEERARGGETCDAHTGECICWRARGYRAGHVG